jgi:hypothetical protein
MNKERSYFDRSQGATTFDPELQSDADIEEIISRLRGDPMNPEKEIKMSSVPSQDQIVAQIRLIIPPLGVIVSAFGVSSSSVNSYEQMILVAAGPIAYAITAIWSLYANSRASIMAAAAKPAAPGIAPPQIVLPVQETALAQTLPSNVNTTANVSVVPK